MSAETPTPLPRHFGSGWISGTLSVALGTLGLGAVLCFHFPSYLTIPDARSYYPLPYIRALLHLVLVAGFIFGFTSIMLRQSKVLGLIGMGLVLVAALLGGSRVQIEGELHDDYYLGLDYFLLNLMAFSLVFIPLEKLFGRVEQGGVFRRGWQTDLIYVFVSSLAVQFMTVVTIKPAMFLFNWAINPTVHAWVSSQPYWVQFLEIVVLTDLVQYWVHRMFHVVPWLWKFHAVHHSAEVMDWMAGSRIHFVDLAVTRAATYIPAYILGFADLPIYIYIIFVAIQSTFIHSNLRFDFGIFRWVFATPQFHHWHHGSEPEAIDKNFAIHLPVLDLFFGTFFLPGKRWPAYFGTHSNDVPKSYLAQWVYPFVRSKKHTDQHEEVVAKQESPGTETSAAKTNP